MKKFLFLFVLLSFYPVLSDNIQKKTFFDTVLSEFKSRFHTALSNPAKNQAEIEKQWDYVREPYYVLQFLASEKNSGHLFFRSAFYDCAVCRKNGINSKCLACGGDGIVWNSDSIPNAPQCKSCKGTGFYEKRICKGCKGSGMANAHPTLPMSLEHIYLIYGR